MAIGQVNFKYKITFLGVYSAKWISLHCISFAWPKVVTGSTDGIGREYAKLIAKQGINIVLISRSLKKLTEVASQIGKLRVVQSEWNGNERKYENYVALCSSTELLYGVKTKCVVIDFNDGKDVYERLELELRDIPIGILGESWIQCHIN